MTVGQRLKKIIPIVLLFSLSNCARKPVQNATEALRPKSVKTIWLDDLELKDIQKALQANVDFLSREQNTLRFGPYQIKATDYAKELQNLLLLAEQDPQQFYNYIREEFVLLEVFGLKRWGDVFVTGYFEPEFDGSITKTKKYPQPLYQKPKDLVQIQLDDFATAIPRVAELKSIAVEQKKWITQMRGRVDEKTISPYWSRAEIDEEPRFKKLAKPIVYMDPIDAFSLHIQGSGSIKVGPYNVVQVGYADQNGHPYEPIGKYIKDKIPPEEMNWFGIEKYLRTLPQEELYSVLAKNPSYIFFERIQGRPKTASGNEVIDERTIATDRELFPKGALGLLFFEKPVFAKPEDVNPEKFVTSSRLVFDHDTGGAIRGPGRVDLFTGRGMIARRQASYMQHPGQLYYFFPKKYLTKP